MQFKRVAQVYKETNLATMPVTDYIIKLLEACLDAVEQCLSPHDSERNEQLAKAQNILFELMAMTNHERSEGKRLFQAYVYLNQCLVQVRLHEDEEARQQFIRYIEEMIGSWTAVKTQRRRSIDRV